VSKILEPVKKNRYRLYCSTTNKFTSSFCKKCSKSLIYRPFNDHRYVYLQYCSETPCRICKGESLRILFVVGNGQYRDLFASCRSCHMMIVGEDNPSILNPFC